MRDFSDVWVMRVKNIDYSFTSLDNTSIWKILHMLDAAHYNISKILVIGFEIYWQFFNISKKYFYNIF